LHLDHPGTDRKRMMPESGLKSVSERKNGRLRIHASNLPTPDHLEFPPGFSPDSRPRSLRHALALIHHVSLAACLLQIKRVPQRVHLGYQGLSLASRNAQLRPSLSFRKDPFKRANKIEIWNSSSVAELKLFSSERNL
jgi:hypothetical protein